MATVSGWRRSSYCTGGECAEVRWVRADCSANSCPEVAHVGDTVQVRSSREPDVVVVFDAGEWAALEAGIKAGEFESGAKR
jgi:hypothetical protein